MAKLVVGGSSVLRMDQMNLDFDGAVTADSTQIHVVYEDGWYNDFFGEFVYDEMGNLIGETLSGITEVYQGTTRFKLTGLEVDVPTFLGFIETGDVRGAQTYSLRGSDELIGAKGADYLLGFAGADLLKGLGGNDRLLGGSGNDTIHGGAGRDTLAGAGGYDKFVFDTTPNGVNGYDNISDFDAAYDTVVLDRTIFSAIDSDGKLAAYAFVNGTAAKDGNDRIIYDKATGNIFYDADGSGAAAKILFAHVDAGTILANTDFIGVA